MGMSAMLVAGQARSTCWDADEAAAASVRDMQTMLIVAALRCQMSGQDITAEYNGFLRDNRVALQTANSTIKRHFLRTAGVVNGQGAYDGFTTALANAYGAGGADGGSCADMALAAQDARLMAGSLEGLTELARRMGVATVLPEGRCAVPDPQPVQIAGLAVERALPVTDRVVAEPAATVEVALGMANAVAP